MQNDNAKEMLDLIEQTIGLAEQGVRPATLHRLNAAAIAERLPTLEGEKRVRALRTIQHLHMLAYQALR